jgi:hypothetical protein
LKKNDTAFICLKESFYREYDIPVLPFPVSQSTLSGSLDKEGITFPEFMDDLLEYLDDNPEEKVKYEPIVSRICFQAGVDEGRAGRYENAHRYLSVSHENSSPGNVSVIQAYAFYCLKTYKYEEAIFEYNIARVLTRIAKTFIPDIWVGLFIAYFSSGNEKIGRGILDGFMDMNNTLNPDEKKALYDKMLLMVNDKRLRERVMDLMESKLFYESS